jgi:hypothetical protein
MKIAAYVQIGITAILIIIILAMLFSKGNKKELGNIQDKYDSVARPHLKKYAILEQHAQITDSHLKETKQKAKTDSISYKKTTSRLRKELAMAKFTGNASMVPEDSVQLAMDCLEKRPYYDSISTTQEIRIVQLEKEKAELVKDYESIMDDNQAEKNEIQAIIDLKDKEIKEIAKRASKRFSVGPHAGYDPFQNKPSFGVSVQYTLFRF